MLNQTIIYQERQYKTSAAIDLHCDAADVVGLLCLYPAKAGGASRLVSSVSVYLRFSEAHPDLVHKLHEANFILDTRGSGGVNWVRLPASCSDDDGQLRTFYHTAYFRSWRRHPDAPAVDLEMEQVLDYWDEIARAPGMQLAMNLSRGDIQLVNNHVLMHARDAYQDGPQKRHLLRLWLSLTDSDQSLWNGASKQWSKLKLVGSFISGKVRRLWHGGDPVESG